MSLRKRSAYLSEMACNWPSLARAKQIEILDLEVLAVVSSSSIISEYNFFHIFTL